MYVDQYIQPRELSEFEKYIPGNYRNQLLKSELSAIATYEGDAEPDKLVGVMVSADHQGWFEIVWIYMSREYRSADKAAEYLRYRLRQIRKTRKYVGAFCEIHVEEEQSLHRDIMALAGMELMYEKNNIYELSLSQIRHRNTLFHAAEGTKCIPLSSAHKYVLEYIEEQIETDHRPIPFLPRLIGRCMTET